MDVVVSSVDVAYTVDVTVVLVVSGVVLVVVDGSVVDVVERVVLCVVLVVDSVVLEAVVNSGNALIPLTVLDRPNAANLGGAVMRK